MHHKYVIFPFVALVGQELMKKALLINAVDPSVGGVLIKGDKGTGKSTAVRALADLLGEMPVVEGCPFRCHPEEIRLMCRDCQERFEKEGSLHAAAKKMEIIDMPLSATEDMVVGSIDIRRALHEGTKALEPGLLARANRNALYIDEVNLLDHHLVNLLLDAAAMGVNIIEREGISLHHPARFILVGTMNPEEGELRPQILDRFGLCVEVLALSDREERLRVIEYRREFDRDGWAFEERFRGEQARLKKEVEQARQILPEVQIGAEMLGKIVDLTTSLCIRTHRADIVMEKTSRVLAALEGRKAVTEEDIKEAAFLVLPHRLRQDPLRKSEPLEREKIELLLQQDLPQELPEETTDFNKDLTLQRELLNPPGLTASGKELPGPPGNRGQYVRAVPSEKPRSLAVDATLRRAVREQGELPVLPEHLMEKVRVTRGEALYIIALDSSSSMRMDKKARLAKSLAWTLLKESYQKRNRVALLAFRGEEAVLLVPPTMEVSRIDEALSALPTGGKTPLTPAIAGAFELAAREQRARPVIVVISDGKGNIFLKDSLEEDLASLAAAAPSGAALAFVNTDSRLRSLGVLERVAETFGSPHFYLEELI